eukprot:283197-Pyramimonas_sp.AAC.1
MRSEQQNIASPIGQPAVRKPSGVGSSPAVSACELPPAIHETVHHTLQEDREIGIAEMIAPEQPRRVLLAGLASDVDTVWIVADNNIMMGNSGHTREHVIRLHCR